MGFLETEQATSRVEGQVSDVHRFLPEGEVITAKLMVDFGNGIEPDPRIDKPSINNSLQNDEEVRPFGQTQSFAGASDI
jgi:hypothetical protein